MTPDAEIIANTDFNTTAQTAAQQITKRPCSLTLGQKRLRLMAILDAELAKRAVFEQRLQQDVESSSSESNSAAIYQQLITKQNQVIARLERRITELTDQLEGPELRQRLKQVEAALTQATQMIEQLKQKLQASESMRSQAEVEIKLLNQQMQDLQELNDNYVNQIAILSLHERQNDEDHAHTVLAISRQLAKHGLNLPAKACIATFDCDVLNGGASSEFVAGDRTGHHYTDNNVDQDVDSNLDSRSTSDTSGTSYDDERFVADARFDQTIFSVRSRQNNQTQILSLVINSIAPDLDIAPIEIKLTEFDPQTQQPITKTLKGFATASAITAAETFAAIHRQLSPAES
ncbi:MAG: hypothetical protein ACTS2F_04485 [Thainema sp.]